MPPYLQPHPLCLWSFAWKGWTFHRADAAAWVTALPRNELLHISCSMETAHVYAWILCNALWGHLHSSKAEIICLLHIYPGEEQSVSLNCLGTSDGTSNMISWLGFGCFRPPGCRKRSSKQEPWCFCPSAWLSFSPQNKAAVCKRLLGMVPEKCCPQNMPGNCLGQGPTPCQTLVGGHNGVDNSLLVATLLVTCEFTLIAVAECFHPCSLEVFVVYSC